MIKRFLILLLACFCFSALSGCSSNETVVKKDSTAITTQAASQAAVPEKPLKSVRVINALAAIVNDDLITLYDVQREAQLMINEKQKTATIDDQMRSQMNKAALDVLIDKTLFKQKIKELNIKVADDEVRQSIDDVKKQNNMTQEALVAALAAQGIPFDQYKVQLIEQLERLKLVSQEVRSNIHVSESEILAYYEANQAKYSEEDLFRARHIFFRTSETAPADDIKRTMTSALLVLAEAKSGKDFIELAKKYSQDPAAQKDGGDMGRFKKGDMQSELENAISALKPGDISELIYTPLGLHIIKLEERSKGKLKPLESVKNEIQEVLYRKKSEERYTRWASDLRTKASIELKDLKGLM